MKEVVKIAIAFYANTQIQNELMDELKGTSIYNQRLKNLGNQIQKENAKIIDRFYEVLDNESEMYFNQSVEMVETLIEVIKKGDIGVLIQLLKDYRDGRISVVDGNKHKKMLDQMEKLKA